MGETRVQTFKRMLGLVWMGIGIGGLVLAIPLAVQLLINILSGQQ